MCLAQRKFDDGIAAPAVDQHDTGGIHDREHRCILRKFQRCYRTARHLYHERQWSAVGKIPDAHGIVSRGTGRKPAVGADPQQAHRRVVPHETNLFRRRRQGLRRYLCRQNMDVPASVTDHQVAGIRGRRNHGIARSCPDRLAGVRICRRYRYDVAGHTPEPCRTAGPGGQQHTLVRTERQ